MRRIATRAMTCASFLFLAACPVEETAPPAPVKPDPPTIGTAVAGDGSAEVSFTPPANSGSQPITVYTVTCAGNAPTRSNSGPASPITVSSLVNGTTYACNVAATSTAGTSNNSGNVGVTPYGVPGTPTIGTVTPSDGTASVAFTAPASNGGSTITGYTASCAPTGGSAVTATGTVSPISVTGLTNGTQYSCTVRATNARGNGASSSAVTVTPATAPGAPTIGTVTAGDGQATVNFTAPTNNGGSTITSYTAACSASGQTTRTVNGSASPLTVMNLANGVEYSCTVTATNPAGTSTASTGVGVTPVGAPAAPTIGAATAGVGQASIAFTAPTNNGGSTITGYTVTCTATSQTDRTGTGTTSPITVTGLASGVQYGCTVKATNAIGTGPASSSVNVTPHSVPAAPTIGTPTPGDGSASIAFTAPSNGGSTITGYTATCTSAGQSNKTGTGTTSPISVAGLVNHIAWSCSVTATNAIGTGSASSSTTVTPAIYCGYSHSIATTNITGTPNAIVQYTCTLTQRRITANQLPDYTPGTFPNGGNPHAIAAQTSGMPWTTPYASPLLPAVASTPVNGTPVSHTLGFAINGVRFDPATAETCPEKSYCPNQAGFSATFNVEALGQTIFSAGVDGSNAHVQPGGVYHLHGMPTTYMSYLTGGQHTGQRMILVGFAIDGFPIYAKWGYTDPNDMTSPIIEMNSGWSLKASPSTGRVPFSDVANGTFTQDWEFTNAGHLDSCNGRTGKTPEYPNGTYHYYVTSTFPYVQRCVKGTYLSLP